MALGASALEGDVKYGDRVCEGGFKLVCGLIEK